ncbi:MAG: hypothetical protein LBT43_09360 [Prevotella sp.]|nr:hypothetical protein [Prevotella sp.]
MKKLTKLRVVKPERLSLLSKEEQNALMGGTGYWMWDNSINEYTYVLDEVVVYGDHGSQGTGSNSGCPACQAGHQFMEDAGYSTRSKGFGYLVLGIEHAIGCCGHQ